MESKTLLKVGVGLSLLLGAAGLAQAQQHVAPRPAPAPRAYLCFDAASAGEVTKKANEAGARGWKMVAATTTRSGAIWCFEQLSGVRPRHEP